MRAAHLASKNNSVFLLFFGGAGFTDMREVDNCHSDLIDAPYFAYDVKY